MHLLYIVLSVWYQANRILLDMDWYKPFCSAPWWYTRLSDYWHAYVNVIMIDLSSAQWNLCVDFLHLLSACVNMRQFMYKENNRSVIINVHCVAQLESASHFTANQRKKSSSVSHHVLQWTFLISCSSNNFEHLFMTRETDFFSTLVLYIQIF